MKIYKTSVKFLQWMEIDRAVSYGVSSAFIQVFSSPITILLIVKYLTPESQGFYYTFASLIALQTYVELGLSVVVVNTASHEWSKLGIDEKGNLIGDSNAISRLVSLGRFIFRWYAVASVIFIILVGIGGHWFFSNSDDVDVLWQIPWWMLIFFSGLSLWGLPFNSLLEGCNQVTTIQRLRLQQMIFRYLALWVTLIAGGELWAAVAAASSIVLKDIYLLGFKYRIFFKSFFSPPNGEVISWRKELVPMQWRLALGGIVSYMLFNAFNPVMFRYHGPIVAGQMGMTLSVVYAIQSIARMWLPPKVPVFGMLIGERKFSELDRIWVRTIRAVIIVGVLGSFSAWVIIYGVQWYGLEIGQRFLGPVPTGMFLIGSSFLAVSLCQTVYLRAHKREPLLVLSVMTSLFMGLLVWFFGSQYGPVGAASSYMFVFGAIIVPWETVIFFKKRSEWHK